ncbi:MAG TPA: CopD family protein [Gemmatimonadaceae bacterium]|nr:CopD family protein [Gemmatimonadaceae bacterium]
MSWGYHLVVTLHVLAALLWLGGMFFLGVVGAPVLRAIDDAALRQRLFHLLGVRFRTAGWVAIAVLVTTGTIMLRARGLLAWSGVLGSAEFWRTPLGVALAFKLATVVTMIAVSAVHDFLVGPAASRGVAGSVEAVALRRRAALLARVNALVGLILVGAAVRLARG